MTFCDNCRHYHDEFGCESSDCDCMKERQVHYEKLSYKSLDILCGVLAVIMVISIYPIMAATWVVLKFKEFFKKGE